jgi:hypothetical protein
MTTSIDGNVAATPGPRPRAAKEFPGSRLHAWVLLVASFLTLNGMGVIYWTAALRYQRGSHSSFGHSR